MSSMLLNQTERNDRDVRAMLSDTYKPYMRDSILSMGLGKDETIEEAQIALDSMEITTSDYYYIVNNLN